MKNNLHGSTAGLKADQIRRLNNLYRRRIPRQFAISPEVARELRELTREIRRQIGLLADRQGRVTHVIVGDENRIVIPDISHYRLAGSRLKGLRCVHTHVGRDFLSRDDLADLALLRLDLMAVITGTAGDKADYRVQIAHVLPDEPQDAPYKVLDPLPPGRLDIGCADLIAAIEEELGRGAGLRKTGGRERAILVSVTPLPRAEAEASLQELAALAASSGIAVVDTVRQQRRRIDPRLLMGRGKLGELAVLALQQAVGLLIFDQELTPAQIRSITNQVELKVIDRTQLILDIFARRAQSREGKLQVEHAQLKYLLPRLATKNTAMSRLTGGIGGRGPGETKLEINRRRVREKITRLEKSLAAVKKQRRQQKSRRSRNDLPVISIIGYTNAGKSTLLNTLTNSQVAAENRLFMTLDPTSRRLKFPRDREVIITDTVGFIRDLPRELKVAFRATLEELESADLFVHVVDISDSRYPDHIDSVNGILSELRLESTPVVFALNKQDRVDAETARKIARQTGGILMSANSSDTLHSFVAALTDRVERLTAVSERQRQP